MRPSQIRKKLRHNEPVLVVTLHFADASGFELASLMGFDGLWIDLEHHAHSLETAQILMRAARVGASDIIARPAKGEFMRLGRLLEAGAQGIIYPRCENAAEAAEVVKWAKFPPLGKRGCDGGNADMPYLSMPIDRYIKEANEQTFVVIQIEEESAVEHADEIAAIDGVDVIFMGPGDFSALGGYPGNFAHPLLERATERIAAAAHRHGKHWGRPAATLAEAKKYIEMGARFIGHNSDVAILKQGLERIQRDFSTEGFCFDNRLTPQDVTSATRSPHFTVHNGSSDGVLSKPRG
jgi:4-hydroxy-2-oxoheptanedioate aldolase